MPSLVDLPTELRQRIFSLVFPDVRNVCKWFSREISTLLHINHQFRADAAELIRSWSPIHYLSNPGHLQSGKILKSYRLNDKNYTPQVQRICLDLFHDGDADHMSWTCYCVHPSNWSHPELIAAWTDAVPSLPLDNITEVFLDITPAPYSKRVPFAPRIIANPWLKDHRVKNFLNCHVVDVGGLILAIHAHYKDRLIVKLTGTLHAKSQSYIDALRRRTGVELEYVGKWITSQEARFAKIETAVTRIVVRKGQRVRLAWVEEIKWSKETRWTYAKVADSGEEQCAIDDLKALVEFRMDEGRDVLEFAPANPERRAFQHRAAIDLRCLRTESEGEEGERHVVVRRRWARLVKETV
ncbi:hypothetical protein DE146DRAFT_218005 [Phaeosphaeria sp. MPI-PUGE-AT-0046c]|nr:hypothetical protein DE146DRAFT_218005 [Phaeosphaeria sp. MPI-PUGE-AT-0046c]